MTVKSEKNIRYRFDGQISYFDKFNSSRWEVTGVNKDVEVILQQREDAVSYTAAGLQQHQPLGLKLQTRQDKDITNKWPHKYQFSHVWPCTAPNDGSLSSNTLIQNWNLFCQLCFERSKLRNASFVTGSPPIPQLSSTKFTVISWKCKELHCWLMDYLYAEIIWRP